MAEALKTNNMERLSKSTFKLRSGNKPSASKLMGVSPFKHYDESTGEQLKTDTSTLDNTPTGTLDNTSTGLVGTRERQIAASDALRDMARGIFGGDRRAAAMSNFRKA